ncbi:MAG: hypothetical protein EBR82_39100 [Caulobacteraceae bacterium]|nr:hypothetical protein [Caulobacteraceae bacterium]
MLLSSPTGAGAVQTPPPVQVAAPDQDQPTDLGDVVVEGRRLDEATRTFIRTVAQPAPGRGLARWRHGFCVGVANLQPEAAQYIVDRISTVAEEVGLRAGPPGCEPRILIIASADADALSQTMVDTQGRLLHAGGAGMDQGLSALRRFAASDAPVRWWTVSVPVDSDTGQRAVRLPGDLLGDGGEISLGGQEGSVLGYAPIIQRRAASRLSTTIIDDTSRVFVILDVAQTSGVTLPQLADYLTLISLAQVNPEADTSGYATILNLFDDPAQTPGLTQWDMAYLKGLYESQRTRLNSGAHRSEIAASIVRVHHDLTAAEEAQPAADGPED